MLLSQAVLHTINDGVWTWSLLTKINAILLFKIRNQSFVLLFRCFPRSSLSSKIFDNIFNALSNFVVRHDMKWCDGYVWLFKGQKGPVL